MGRQAEFRYVPRAPSLALKLKHRNDEMKETYLAAMSEMSFTRHGDMWVRQVTRGQFSKTIYVLDAMAKDSTVLKPALERMIKEAQQELSEQIRLDTKPTRE